jgi:hypothetical protein
MKPRSKPLTRVLLSIALLLGALLPGAGCQKREKIFELDAPGVNVDVEKSNDGVQVDVRRDEEENP